MDKPQFVYVTYIATTLEQLWDALTSEDFTQQYWGGKRLQSDWQVGSPVKPVKEEDDSDLEGEVLESDPPYRLSYTFQSPDSTESQPSRVVFDLQPNGSTVKLTLTHTDLDAKGFMAISQGWSAVLSNLKSLLETREPLLLAALR